MKIISILVVLDDALVLAWKENVPLTLPGLNPCCAGRCSNTRLDGGSG